MQLRQMSTRQFVRNSSQRKKTMPRINAAAHLGKRLLSDSPSQMVIANLIAMALGPVSILIVARVIGPEGRGLTAAALALFSLVPIILAFGVPIEMRRQTTIHGVQGTLRAARWLWLAAIVPATALGVLISFTVFAALDGLERFLIVLGTSTAPATMAWIGHQSVLLAVGRYRAVATLRLATPTVLVGSLLIGWPLGAVNVPYVLAANILGTIATMLLGALLTRGPAQRSRLTPVALLRGGMRFSGSAIAEATAARLDQILALPILGAYESGLYSVGVTLAILPLSIGHALGASLFNAVTACSVRNFRPIALESLKASTSAGAALAVPLILVCPLAIPIAFGPDFSAAVPAALIMIAFGGIVIAGYAASMTLAAIGRGKSMTIAQLGSLVVRLCLLIVLGPTMGSVGAGIAYSLSTIVLLVLLLNGSGIRLRAVLPSFSGLRKARTLLFS